MGESTERTSAVADGTVPSFAYPGSTAESALKMVGGLVADVQASVQKVIDNAVAEALKSSGITVPAIEVRKVIDNAVAETAKNDLSLSTNAAMETVQAVHVQADAPEWARRVNDAAVVQLEGPLTADRVQPGVMFLRPANASVSNTSFIEHLKEAGASQVVVAAAEAAARTQETRS